MCQYVDALKHAKIKNVQGMTLLQKNLRDVCDGLRDLVGSESGTT